MIHNIHSSVTAMLFQHVTLTPRMGPQRWTFNSNHSKYCDNTVYE